MTSETFLGFQPGEPGYELAKACVSTGIKTTREQIQAYIYVCEQVSISMNIIREMLTRFSKAVSEAASVLFDDEYLKALERKNRRRAIYERHYKRIGKKYR